MSTYAEQKIKKPKIEDVAMDFLDEKRTADILDLAGFLKANKIGARWASANSWTLVFKGKRLGSVKIYYIDAEYERLFGKSNPLTKSWMFCQRRECLDRYYSMDECELKTFAFEHIYAKSCGSCFVTCRAGADGQTNLSERKAGYMNPTGCGCWPLRVYNPEGESLELTKKLLEFWMKCVLDDKK